jgi:hypothetical protein
LKRLSIGIKGRVRIRSVPDDEAVEAARLRVLVPDHAVVAALDEGAPLDLEETP